MLLFTVQELRETLDMDLRARATGLRGFLTGLLGFLAGLRCFLTGLRGYSLASYGLTGLLGCTVLVTLPITRVILIGME